MSKTSQVTRRDFLNGTLLSIGAVASTTLINPSLTLGAESESLMISDYYPPTLTGMRGSHKGSFEVAHELARRGRQDWGTVKNIDESVYDLVVVGSGLSGLAAARFFQQKYGKNAKILLLDNHDDFGGHAKRNEFSVNGQTRLSYGGSQSMENPSAYSEMTKGLLKDLGVEYERFEKKYYDLDFFKRHGLGGAIFFDEEHYGQDLLIKEVPMSMGEGMPGIAESNISFEDVLDQMPFNENAKKQLQWLFEEDHKDALDEIPVTDRLEYAENNSYYDYLREYLEIDEPQIFEFFRNLSASNMGSGLDTLSLLEAAATGMPGTNARAIIPLIGNKIMKGYSEEEGDLYVHHFPDGNASLARLLVRKLIPRVAPGDTMEDIVTARFDYGQLDQPSSNVRLRLNSTVVKVTHRGTPEKAKEVEVTYINQKQAYRVRGKKCVMACYNMIIPYLIPELPEKQKESLKELVKAPLVYSNVMIKNWHALKNQGIGAMISPRKMHTITLMDFPVEIGEYPISDSPDQPMSLTMMYVPVSDEMGLPARDQHRLGRYKLLTTSFATFEKEIREHLDAMLGPGGFDSNRDIEAITVNRWSHGYAYGGNMLEGLDFEAKDAPHILGRKKFGQITIANSDSGAVAYLDSAIDQAWRAIQEFQFPFPASSKPSKRRKRRRGHVKMDK